ncbi:exopolysaccharide biosynthesis GT4 family glycosyltransferase EpsE [Wenxinia marina]|uniref:Glycosyltransferase n=1 Tax=Wenxinia marina DSM 24838 TaxID=1123501 RepID=A0A0D0NRQ0_9RHOB|nr:exopolysaccharide biosynthesis GT4 family glycosyltransferase EpsE [Wenxinia marina]KIQ70915.1 Glycosyltransferase [Wenxinia marina DSM 24838]GGL56326.1 colanic acid biosynthesis glycosyltransferase WcaL [Wenxinia marina]
MRLGYLVPQFPGQTHIFFWREIRELRRRGVHVDLLSTRPPPRGLIAHDWSDEAMAETTYLGRADPVAALAALSRQDLRELVAATRAEGRPFLRDVALSLPAAQRLLRHARERRLDHVHVHSCGRAGLIAALAREMGGPPFSLTLHGPLSDYGTGQPLKWRRAAFATVITDRLMDEVRRTIPVLPPRLEVQPMGVDTDRLRRPAPYVPHDESRPLRIFSCGRLNRVKGHQDLMQAVRLLRDGGRDATLAIAGEDDAGGTGYRATLEARIAELGLGDAVTLLGAIDEGAVVRHLLEADVFVLASWHEPLGVALMEAMSCAVPTIGTDAGGVGELIVDGRDGLLVPPKSPDALATAIARVADDPALAARLSAGGRARVETAFHSGRGAETLIRLIEETRRAG